MPPVRRQHKKVLPGTDPTFHVCRRYLSPVMYKGKEILAFHASCREQGCQFSSAWASDAGRDLGMWRHRSEKVQEARRDQFIKEYGGNLGKVEAAMLRTADKNSHTFENWAEAVEVLYRGRIGEDFTIELENPQLRKDYHLGLLARETTARIYAENYG